MTRRDANDCIADGATLDAIAALFGWRRQTVHRIERDAIRKIWRRQVAAPHPPPGRGAQAKGAA